MSKEKEKETSREGEGEERAPRRAGRGRPCKFCADANLKIDYKNASLLKFFITDRGKLVPRRLSGNCALHQRAIATAVQRARMIALMPFSVTAT